MPEPQAIQAVVTAPSEIDPNQRIEQIFLYNSDGTPYEGGGPGGGSGPTGNVVISGGIITPGLSNNAVPSDLTSFFRFGLSIPGPSLDWTLPDRTIALANSTGSEIVGNLDVSFPYYFVIPHPISTSEIVAFRMTAKLKVDEVLEDSEIIAISLGAQPLTAENLYFTGRVNLKTHGLTIPPSGSTIAVGIESGLIRSTGVMGGVGTLIFAPPRFSFVGQ